MKVFNCNIKKFAVGCIHLIILLSAGSCYFDTDDLTESEAHLLEVVEENYKTENIVVVVIDGVRQSESWRHPSQKYIPAMKNKLSPKGVVLSNFFNLGNTHTVSGLIAITTGNYEYISNMGDHDPREPSFFQLWLKASNMPQSKAWLITSKEKLNVLANCKDLEWRATYKPSVNAENRSDEATLEVAKEILQEHRPQISLIHFGGTDWYAHKSDWNKYLNSITETDSLVFELWKFLEDNEYYKATTTLFVTNDHGRHLDNIATGFADHGDHCLGCTHLNFYTTGPDFNKNLVLDQKREQIDILPTIGELMGFRKVDAEGKIMWELFK